VPRDWGYRRGTEYWLADAEPDVMQRLARDIRLLMTCLRGPGFSTQGYNW
jgi:hypothetical protein